MVTCADLAAEEPRPCEWFWLCFLKRGNCISWPHSSVLDAVDCASIKHFTPSYLLSRAYASAQAQCDDKGFSTDVALHSLQQCTALAHMHIRQRAYETLRFRPFVLPLRWIYMKQPVLKCFMYPDLEP